MARKAKIRRIIWRVKKQNVCSKMPQSNDFGEGLNESNLYDIRLF